MTESMLRSPGLATVWVRAFADRGVDSSVSLELWRDQHTDPASADRVNMLERWAGGAVRIVDLASQFDVPHSRVQTMLTGTALQLISPHLADLPRWAQARAAGVEDEAIAELSGTTAVVVSLALDGWPSRQERPVEDGRLVEALLCWRDGGSRADVAAVLGIPAPRLVKQLRSGESVLIPRRLTSTDLRERYGWTSSAVAIYRRKGVLPVPDGQDGQRDWWWESTIEAWEKTRDLVWCQKCRHAFVSPIGSKEHCTRVHGL